MGSNHFSTEAWTEYAVGVVLILLRIVARFETVEISHWQWDDWLMLPVLVFWTAELTMLELIGRMGTNANIPPDVRPKLTAHEIARLELGSKYLIAGWIFYVTGLWCMKACVLIFYRRLCRGLWQQIVVQYLSYACVATYVASILTIFLHCTPIRKQWQVTTDPGDKCTLPILNTVVVGALNISTDAVLLIIPYPLLMHVAISRRRKIAIGLLLFSGVFVIVATILRIYFVLQSGGVNNVTIWAVRECTVAILVINIPVSAPLVNAYLRGRTYEPESNSGPYFNSRMKWSSANPRRTFATKSGGTIGLRSTSEDRILYGEDTVKLEIQTARTYEVHCEAGPKPPAENTISTCVPAMRETVVTTITSGSNSSPPDHASPV